MRILMTGGTGYIGKNLLTKLVKEGHNVVSIENPRVTHPYWQLASGQYTRVLHDFRAPIQDAVLKEIGSVDVIFHLGAMVQALGSLQNPRLYVESNVLGTFNLLEAARKLSPKKFIYFSSGEVFGETPEGYSEEYDQIKPATPYSAGKAAGEMLCHAYSKTFGVPITILRTMNVFGPGQQLSRFVPMMADKIIHQEPVNIHIRDGRYGSRQWIYIDNLLDAVSWILKQERLEPIYHVAGVEADNEQMIHLISGILGVDPMIVPTSAPVSHSMRFAMNDQIIRYQGWTEPFNWHAGLEETVLWQKQCS